MNREKQVETLMSSQRAAMIRIVGGMAFALVAMMMVAVLLWPETMRNAATMLMAMMR